MFYLAESFAVGAPMTPLSAEELHARIAQPSAELSSHVQMLRRIRSLDADAYRRAKTQLPWFIGAEFRDQTRRVDHFIRISYLVVDFDHCAEAEGGLEGVRERLKKDPRILLLFASPGGEGLKCVFALESPMGHTKLFSDFYQAFAAAFARAHGLEAYADLRTHDVTRVCFLSADPGAYLNPWPEALDWEPLAQRQLMEAPAPELRPQPAPPEREEKAAPSPGQTLPPGVYAEIRKRLQGSKPPRAPRSVYVPDALRETLAPLQQAAAEFGIQLDEASDIQYGKKLRFSFGGVWAELNVFHGKNGFSIVKSPKRGSDEELCSLVQELASRVLLAPPDLSGLRGQLFPPPAPEAAPPAPPWPEEAEALPPDLSGAPEEE
jgi:hypothetical protein